MKKKNQAIKTAKEQGVKYVPFTFENDDIPKQLLARSRYIIAKKTNDWTENQKIRAELLFENYPLLHKAYKHTLEFRNIYEETSREIAKEKILNWIEKTKLLKMTVFNTAENSLKFHLETILNFFIKRHTNAESFNSKIKLFRANQRGVVDVKFFLFRIEEIFCLIPINLCDPNLSTNTFHIVTPSFEGSWVEENKKPHFVRNGVFKERRRHTLPHNCSTICAGGLNFSVRDGKR